MSLSYYWKPLKDGARYDVLCPSKLYESLCVAFGSQPWVIEEKDLPLLRGMAIGGLADVSELIKIVEEHGPIELKAV